MIYDITQEVFSGKVYPGDTPPSCRKVKSIAAGDGCNLTDIEMCAHNGTHADAPSHFIEGGKSIDRTELSRYLGECAVRAFGKRVRAEDLEGVDAPRLLIKGECVISDEAAARMCGKFLLVGVEMQSVGGETVHKILLGGEVAVLEGLRLAEVPDGTYFLSALPVKLGGADGAPVRAVLMTR